MITLVRDMDEAKTRCFAMAYNTNRKTILQKDKNCLATLLADYEIMQEKVKNMRKTINDLTIQKYDYIEKETLKNLVKKLQNSTINWQGNEHDKDIIEFKIKLINDIIDENYAKIL